MDQTNLAGRRRILSRVETAKKLQEIKNEKTSTGGPSLEDWNPQEVSKFVAIATKSLWFAANRAKLHSIERLMELAFYDAYAISGGKLGLRSNGQFEPNTEE
jgi:hypothetical protein